MAGELSFRILDRKAYERLSADQRQRAADAKGAFLDAGEWSLTESCGPHAVVVEGSAFYLDAPWMYDGHHLFDALSSFEDDTATLLVPRELVEQWRARLLSLPHDGEVARSSARVRDALVAMMDVVLANDALALTLRSLL